MHVPAVDGAVIVDVALNWSGPKNPLFMLAGEQPPEDVSEIRTPHEPAP